jgi:PAS domain S-box-containing protein
MRDEDKISEQAAQELQTVRPSPPVSAEPWKVALERSGTGMWDWYVPSNEFVYSRQLMDILGECGEETSPRPWMERVHPEDAPIAEEHLGKTLRDENTGGSAEYRVRCNDGTYKWILAACAITSRGEDGLPVSVLGLISDTTERKETDQRLERMAETIPAAIFIIQDGRMRYVNLYMELKSGYTSRELFGMHPLSLVHPKMWETVKKGARARRQGGSAPSRYEVRFIAASGQEFVGDMSTATITYRRRPAVMGIIYDISESKRAEEALRESESKYRALFQNANDAIFLMGGETIIACNEKTLEMFGYEKGEIVGRTPFDLSPPLQPTDGPPESLPRQRIKRALSGDSQCFEWKHRRHDGTLFDAEVSLARIDLDGTPFLHCIIRDITDRKMREEALAESERKFKNLAEKSLAGIYLIQDGLFRYVNPKFAEILGFRPDELIETIPHEETLLPEDRTEVVEHLRKRTAGEVPSVHHEFRIVTRTGEVRNVEVYGSRTVYRGKPAVIGTLLDITERKQSEELLRQAEEKYRSIFENCVEGIFQMTPDGANIVINDALLKMFGYDTPEEILTRVNSREADFFVRPEKLSELARLFDEEGGARGFQVEQHRKDGTIIWVSINSRAIKAKDGSLLRYEGIIEDITERKQAEERIRRSEAGLKALIGSMNDTIAIVNRDGSYMRINPAHPDKLFMPEGRSLEKTLTEAVPEKTADRFLGAVRKALKTRRTVSIEYNLPVRGEERWFSAALSPMTKESAVCVARDITNLKVAENNLQAKSLSLEETNSALKVLLRNMEGAKKELEENVVSNIRVLVMPTIEKLAKLKLGDAERACVESIKTSLKDIASPFLHGLSRFNLTPTEIQVANYVRDGHTTKEIVELTHSTKDSIDMHRYNIRKKMGINKGKTNLRSYLLSIH